MLYTIDEIARSLDVKVARVLYILKSRKIVPIKYAGHSKLFDDTQVAEIRMACLSDNRCRDNKKKANGYGR